MEIAQDDRAIRLSDLVILVAGAAEDAKGGMDFAAALLARLLDELPLPVPAPKTELPS